MMTLEQTTSLWLLLISVATVYRVVHAVFERRDVNLLRKDLRINTLLLRVWAQYWGIPSDEMREKLLALLRKEGINVEDSPV